MPVLPADLPDKVRPVAAEGVNRLIVYQGPGYAQLYIARLKRFIGRRNVDDAAFANLARLMVVRMAYHDAIGMAQLKLAEAEKGPGVPPDDVRQAASRRGGVVAAGNGGRLRALAAGVFGMAAPAGYHAASAQPAASAFAASKSRPRSSDGGCPLIRYANERAWVERWLHMIDRSLAKQPAAVAAVVATAELVQGYGDGYIQSLRDWNLIIDNLVKPTFDGALSCPDLAGAIAEARAAVVQIRGRLVEADDRGDQGAGGGRFLMLKPARGSSGILA